MKCRKNRGSKASVVFAAASLAVVVCPHPASAFHSGVQGVTCTNDPNGLPEFTFDNGSPLAHPEIVPIFWGSYWNSAPSPGRPQLVGAVQGLLNGAYTAGLQQYGVGPMRMVPTTPIYSSTTPSPHCDDGTTCPMDKCKNGGSLCGMKDVERTVNSVIGAGLVPGPAADTNMLYMVYVPPGFNTTFFGANYVGTCDSSCGSQYNGHQYSFAWVVSEGSGGLSEMMSSTSHELAEAVTNYVRVTNCTYTSGAFQGQAAIQIADLCGVSETQLGGNGYNAYWSYGDNECVIPEGWGSVLQYNAASNSWTQIGGPAHELYAGSYGLVMTDGNDNPMLYTGTPNQWTTIGSPGAMYAVGSGGNTILGMSLDSTTFFEYSGSGTTWSVLPSAGGSSIYAGNSLYATDYDGNLYRYSGGSWGTGLAGKTDQIGANSAGVVVLALDHQSIWANVNGQVSGWGKIFGSASEVFVGNATNIAAADLTATRDVWFLPSNGSWANNGNPEMTYAVTTDGSLFSLGLGGLVEQSSNPSATMPSWGSDILLQGTRLVGHGTTLYATQGIVY